MTYIDALIERLNRFDNPFAESLCKEAAAALTELREINKQMEMLIRADTAMKWRKKVGELEAEIAKLREALEKIARWAKECDGDDTYYDIMVEARAALGEKP